MTELIAATTELKSSHGTDACREAVALSWRARQTGDHRRSDFMLKVAIRLCWLAR
jgi:hypothetical protein